MPTSCTLPFCVFRAHELKGVIIFVNSPLCPGEHSGPCTGARSVRHRGPALIDVAGVCHSWEGGDRLWWYKESDAPHRAMQLSCFLSVN